MTDPGSDTPPGAAATRPLTVRLAARPARVGVFVPLTSSHELLTDIDPLVMLEQGLAARCGWWGGSSHLVFPLPADQDELVDHELLWALLDVFDADSYLVHAFIGRDLLDMDAARATTVLEAIGAEWSHSPQREIARDDFLDSPVEDWRFAAALHEALVRRLAPLHFKEDLSTSGTDVAWNTVEPPGMALSDVAELPPIVTAPATTLGPAEALLLSAETGRLTGRDADRLVVREVAVDQAVYNDHRLLYDRLFPTALPPSPEPWTIGEAGCSWYMTRRNVRQPTTVVVGEDPWDFALFYALRRLTGQAFWIPTSLIDDRSYGHRLARVLRSQSQRHALTVQFTSYSNPSLPQVAHAALARALGRQLSAEFVDWRQTISTEPNRLFGTGQYGRDEPVLMHERRTPGLPTPTINDVRAIQDTQTSWLVDVDVRDWRPVRHAELGQHVLWSGARSSTTQRCSQTGPSYIATSAFGSVGASLESLTVRPELRPLDLTAQLGLAAAARGWRVEPSDKGAYARRAETIFGPVRDLAAALRRPDVGKVLAAYLAPQRQDGAVGWFSTADRRRYLSLEDVRGLVAADADADGLVDDLRRRGALALGSLLKCRRCRQASWYDVDDFGRTFVCSRCRHEQASDPFSWLGRPEPVWSYRLDEALRQFLEHDGDLPALAAADLVADSRLPVAAAYELDIFDADNDKSELDIALADGATLWIGEATTSPRLERTNEAEVARLTRLKAVANVLNARHVLLVNAGTWDAGTITRAEVIVPDAWAKLHIVHGQARAAS